MYIYIYTYVCVLAWMDGWMDGWMHISLHFTRFCSHILFKITYIIMRHIIQSATPTTFGIRDERTSPSTSASSPWLTSVQKPRRSGTVGKSPMIPILPLLFLSVRYLLDIPSPSMPARTRHTQWCLLEKLEILFPYSPSHNLLIMATVLCNCVSFHFRLLTGAVEH